MQVFHDLESIKGRVSRMAVALGNFDGVHMGHRFLIGETVARAQRSGVVPAVFTFNPHPVAVLDPVHAPPLLLSREKRERIIAALGVEVMLWVPFTRAFARMSPREFIEEVLCAALRVQTVVVGYNYNFGYKGEGKPELLKREGDRLGFEVLVVEPVKVDGVVVSSTLIRRLLTAGDVVRAGKFLGYRPLLEGLVVGGEKKGATLGFPTANLLVDKDLLVPGDGVYAVEVALAGRMFVGVANIGSCPTVKKDACKSVEVHILDFTGDLYGQHIAVHFHHRLREERAFSSVAALVDQIKRDISAARQTFLAFA